ncbi:unnamed protein product, partial [Prunus brigantina]
MPSNCSTKLPADEEDNLRRHSSPNSSFPISHFLSQPSQTLTSPPTSQPPSSSLRWATINHRRSPPPESSSLRPCFQLQT